jgi:hypothetical protein
MYVMNASREQVVGLLPAGGVGREIGLTTGDFT